MLRLVFDTEANHFELSELHTMWCIAAVDYETRQEYKFWPHQLRAGLELLSKADELIGHNIIHFDCAALKHLFKWEPRHDCRITDTLILSRMLNPDRKRPLNMVGKAGPHSIEAWGYRLGRHKVEHEDWSQFSEDMMHRCLEDAHINAQVYRALLREASE